MATMKEENNDAIVLEEWNAFSTSNFVRTAVLVADKSGGFSIHRERGRMRDVWRKLSAAFLPESNLVISLNSWRLPMILGMSNSQIFPSFSGLPSLEKVHSWAQNNYYTDRHLLHMEKTLPESLQWRCVLHLGFPKQCNFRLSSFSDMGFSSGIVNLHTVHAFYTSPFECNRGWRNKSYSHWCDISVVSTRFYRDVRWNFVHIVPGMLMDLVSPLYPASFVIILCLGSIARSFTGVASGATRAALTQHFALQHNAADISAKEGSQETMATMIGMLLGMLLAHVTAGHPAAMWSSFLLLTLFHMFANYQAVRCLCLNSLNEERTSVLLKCFITNGQVLTPKDVSAMEHLLPNWMRLRMLTRDRLFNVPVKLGAKISSLSQSDMSKLLRLSASCYGKEKYLLLYRNGTIEVILNKDSVSADILQSYIHGLVLSYHMGSSSSINETKNADSCLWMEKYYSMFISKLQASGWNTGRLLVPSVDWRAHWVESLVDGKAT